MNSYQKGHLFEMTTKDFFLKSSSFSHFGANIHGFFGELDHVLELVDERPIYRGFNPVVLVECKCLKTKVELTDVLKFRSKATTLDSNLCFFVTQSSFTPDAMEYMVQQVLQKHYMVPIYANEMATVTDDQIDCFLHDKIFKWRIFKN